MQLARLRSSPALRAAVLYLALTCLLLWPLPVLAGRALDNPGDPLLNTWILAWDWHALTTNPAGLFDANIFYPNRHTLAYSENLVVTAVLAAPVNALTGNPVLAHNFALLLSFPLTALAAYALIKHLSGSWPGAFVGGLIFAFAHYRIGQLSHLQLLTVFWPPLALLGLHRFVEQPKLRWAALVGLCVGLQWWTTIYYALYLVLAAALFALWAFAGGWLRLTRATLLGGLLAVVIAGLIVAPGLGPYLEVGRTVGGRTLGQQEGATVADYLRPGPQSLLGRVLGLTGGRWEHTLFPGLVALGLAGLGFARRAGAAPSAGPRRWSPFTYYLLLALAGLVLSFGPDLALSPESPPLIHGMPYAWLYRAFPPLAALRVPARLSMLAMLGLAVLAGQGAAWLARRCESRQFSWPYLRLRGDSLVAFALSLALALEYLAAPVPHVPIETGAAVPPVYRWLATQQFEGSVFELPTARTPNITDDQLSIQRIARQQYFSVYHWHPLPIGYSGANAPTFEDVIDFAPAAASPPGLAVLRNLGVRRIVVHRDQMTWDEWATFAESAARQPGLAWLADIGESTVYALAAEAPAPPLQAQAAGLDFAPGLRLESFELSGGSEHVAGEALLAGLHWRASAAAGRGRAVSLQLIDGAGSKVSQAEYFFPVGGEWPAGPGPDQWSVLALPRDLVPGKYTLRAIVYRAADLAPVGEPADLAALDIRQPPDFLIQRPFPAWLAGSIALLGFDAEFTARPGESFRLTLYWQRLAPLAQDYTVFVHLRRPDGTVLVQQDNPPRAGTHATSAWRAGETVLDRYNLPIPADAAPGTYTLAVGMYLPGGGSRLPAYDAQGSLLPDGSLVLGSIEIAP